MKSKGDNLEPPRSYDGRLSPGRWILLLLTLIPLVALPWTVEFWPGQDDANHFALAHILQNFDEPGSPFPEHFTINHDLSPYKLYYFLLLFLSQFMGLVDANRIVVSLVIAGLPLVMLFWLRRFAPERQINSFLICLLATCMLPVIGFHPFMLSFLFGLAALAMASGMPDAEGTRQPAGWGALTVASALLFISSIGHPVAPVMIGGVLFVIEAPRRNLKAWLRLAIVGAPAILLLGLTSLGSSSGGNRAAFEPSYPGIIPNLRFLIVNLKAFHPQETLLRLPVLVVLISAGVLAIRRHGVRGQGRDQCIARVFLVFLAAFFLVPNFPALSYIPDRFSYLVLLVAALLPLPCWAIRRPSALCVVALILSLSIAAIQYREIRRLSDHVSEVVAAGQTIPRGSKVLPLMFKRPKFTSRVNPMLHAWGYLVVDRDIVTPYLFAKSNSHSIAGGGWRPVSYAHPFGPDTMPYLDEWFPASIAHYGAYKPGIDAQIKKQHILNAMLGYDRVIMVSPPKKLLEEAMETMEQDHQVGNVWVLKPRKKAGRADATERED